MSPRLSTKLFTERLILRPPSDDDIAALRAHLRRNADHYRPWSPQPAPGDDPTSLTALSKLVVRQRSEWRKGRAYSFVVTSHDDFERILGRIALTDVSRGIFQNAYLGYSIDRDHQGKGLMTEAVRAATTFALGPLELHRVQAAVMPRNAASVRVLEKLGFRKEGHAERYLCIAGRWEDHILFAKTAEESS